MIEERPYICPGCDEEIGPDESYVLADELLYGEMEGFGHSRQEPGTGERVRFHEGHFAQSIGPWRYQLVESE